ncbi:MAG: tetratricopeptide repeat protein [Prevotellaceae bacterium]|jgi:tetratricopeptide (TPR) repeat protein|nr:tetratricopeptide repeat protein [Prevotellaceae bacterium]
MTPALLQHWIQHPESLNHETLYELRTLMARYPYFQSLHLLYLKNLYLLHDSTFGTELRRSVLYVADRRTLFYLIEGDRHALRIHPVNSILPEETTDGTPHTDRTATLIDAFLAQAPEEYALMSIPDYAMDYTAYLLHEEQDPTAPDANPALPEPAPVQSLSAESDKSDEATDDQEESCFTETLAKIYIKQQRYEKALEIIRKLSLNYPKKNAYFADQIRFLEKLIINAKSK